MLKYFYVCVGNVNTGSVLCLNCECFVMLMFYVCVFCAASDSPQCCVLHDLQFVKSGRGCKRRPYGRGSKRHNLQAVELSQQSQTAVQIVSNLSARFIVFGKAGHADPMDGWRCSS